MKKIFTLIAVALATMSVNAQEKYEAITAVIGEDGKIASVELAPEFKAVVTDADGNVGTVANNVTSEGSVVMVTVGNVTMKGIAGSTPADVYDDPRDLDNDGKVDNTNDTHVDINADGTVNSWKPIEWKTNKNNDCLFPWIQGTGNPGAIIVRPVMQDDMEVTYWDPITEQDKVKYTYDIQTYNPDGSLGCPDNGLHYQFTAAVNGVIKIGVWVNKGNRNTFVVDGATALPVEYTAEGYINGKKDAEGKMIYFSQEQLDSLHKTTKNYIDSVRNEDGVATGEIIDLKPYIIGPGNQAFFGYITFEMEAGKTYYVFNDNTQLGFNGWEFTPSAVAPAIPDNAIYFWESPDGTPVEKGGKIEYMNGDGERLNYSNAGYHTICLNGKKGNMNDAPAANSGYMLLTLDEALQAGDFIDITAYRNKNADGKNATIQFYFENGAEWADSKSFVNICADENDEDYDDDGATPNTHTWEITAAEAGSKTIKLTRNSASTNLFITKFIITRGASGIQNVEVATPANNAIYNLSGQKVDANFKGIIIVNGKKFFNK